MSQPLPSRTSRAAAADSGVAGSALALAAMISLWIALMPLMAVWAGLVTLWELSGGKRLGG